MKTEERSAGIFQTDVKQHDRDIMFAEKTVSVLTGRNKTAQAMGTNKLPTPQTWSVSQVAIHKIALKKTNGMINIVDFDCPREISNLDAFDDELADFVSAFIAWSEL